MEQLNLMERFADPALFEGLSFSDKVAGSLVTTLMGMGTTFAVLVLLWGIIAFISRLIQKSERVPASAVVVQPAGVSAKNESSSLIEPERIAVIAAAIVAYDNQLDLRNMRILRVKQSQENTWIKPKAGTIFSMDSAGINGVVDLE